MDKVADVQNIPITIILLLCSVENGTSVEREALYLEKEILMPLAGTGKALVYQTTKWWSQLKTPGAAIYANRHYLNVMFYSKFVKEHTCIT